MPLNGQRLEHITDKTTRTSGEKHSIATVIPQAKYERIIMNRIGLFHWKNTD